jgi:DUF1680 family protein
VSADHNPDLLDGVTTVETDVVVPDTNGWERRLYRPDEETDIESTGLPTVPYYAWDNRDPGAMQVWLRSDST